MLNQNKQVVDIEKYLHNICVCTSTVKNETLKMKSVGLNIKRAFTVDQKQFLRQNSWIFFFYHLTLLSFIWKCENSKTICSFKFNCFTIKFMQVIIKATLFLLLLKSITKRITKTKFCKSDDFNSYRNFLREELFLVFSKQ